MSSLQELRARFFKREIAVNREQDMSWWKAIFRRKETVTLLQTMIRDMSMMERAIRHTYRALGLKAHHDHWLLALDFKWVPTHFHRKRKSKDLLIGGGSVQVSSGAPLEEGDEVAIYQDRQGRLWVRRYTEFEDGRFGEIAVEGYPYEEEEEPSATE